jgi:hypothetical protein
MHFVLARPEVFQPEARRARAGSARPGPICRTSQRVAGERRESNKGTGGDCTYKYYMMVGSYRCSLIDPCLLALLAPGSLDQLEMVQSDRSIPSIFLFLCRPPPPPRLQGKPSGRQMGEISLPECFLLGS